MNYCEMTAHELHSLLTERKITSEELVKAHMERINKFDCAIDAYLERTNENALETARNVDAKIMRGEEINALEGIAILPVKQFWRRCFRIRVIPKKL